MWYVVSTLHIQYHHYSADRGAEYCDRFVCLSVCVCVCLSMSISLEPLDRSSQNFLCRSPVAVARSSSDAIAIHCVLPVLWITLRLAVVGQVGQPTTTSCVATLGRSLMSVNACCVCIFCKDDCQSNWMFYFKCLQLVCDLSHSDLREFWYVGWTDIEKCRITELYSQSANQCWQH